MSRETKTVLVVDDEAATRRFIRAALRQAGYAILEAQDSDTAANMHSRHQGEIDLLLTDVSLPGRNGCELAIMLQEIDPGLKVLYMSGAAGAELCQFNGVPTDDYHFLQKPFRAAALLQRVKSFFEPCQESTGSASA